jgi:hypothetical protein
MKKMGPGSKSLFRVCVCMLCVWLLCCDMWLKGILLYVKSFHLINLSFFYYSPPLHYALDFFTISNLSFYLQPGLSHLTRSMPIRLFRRRPEQMVAGSLHSRQCGVLNWPTLFFLSFFLVRLGSSPKPMHFIRLYFYVSFFYTQIVS